MKATLKLMVAKVMTAGLMGGALMLATPKKAEAQQFSIGVQIGRPVVSPGYYAQPGYYAERDYYARRRYEQERLEAIARREAWERRQAWLRHEQRERWEREHHNGWRNDGWDRR